MRTPSFFLRLGLGLAVILLFVTSAAFPQTVDFLGIPSMLNTGNSFPAPVGIAVDVSGNVFVWDHNNRALSKIVAVNGSIPASPAIQTLSPTYSGNPFSPSSVTGMGMDSSGNLFLASNLGVFEIAAAGGYATATLLLANGNIGGVAMDANGDVYLCDEGAREILELVASSSYAPTTVIDNTHLASPVAVAVDAAGDVFVSDNNGTSVKEFTAGNYTSAPATLAMLISVVNMAVDAGGNLIVPDSAHGIYEFTASSGYLTKIQLNSSITKGTDVAVAPNGNLFFSSEVLSGPGVYEIAMNMNFGSLNLGTTTAAKLTLPFLVANGITISSISLLTLGTPNLDFKNDATSTCNNTSTNTTCNVVVDFKPVAPGLRRGAIVINSTDALSETFTTTVPIYGVGDAPQLATFPGTSTVLSTGTSTVAANDPGQIAFDGAGNLYLANCSNGLVYKIPAGGGTPTTIDFSALSGLGPNNCVNGVVLDGAGNMYVSDHSNQRIVVVNGATGSSPSPALVLPLSSPSLGSISFDDPYTLAMDPQGNLYIADSANVRILKVGLTGAGTDGVAGQVTLLTPNYAYDGGDEDQLYGVAVDKQGNVYIPDYYAGNLVEATPAGAITTINLTYDSNTFYPTGIGLDAFGNVYLVDGYDNWFAKLTTSGTLQPILTPGLALGLNGPWNLSVDPAGKFYISDYSNNRVVILDPTNPYVASFATTGVGATSEDSPQTFTLFNIGDQNLTFTGITYPASFPSNVVRGPCSISSPLPPTEQCDVSVNFIPQVAGDPVTGNLQLKDNNLNVANSTQNIALSGPSTATGTSITFVVEPDPPFAGKSTTFTATISPPPGSPYGSVSFKNGSALLGTGTVNSEGVAVFTTTRLTAGAMSVTAVYPGNGGYNGSTSAAQSITVKSGQTSTHIVLATSPNPVTAGFAVTLTATVTPAPTGSSPGTVKFYDGETLLATVTLVSGVATYTADNLPGGSDTLTAVYSGNASFAGATSSAVTQKVNASYTVSAPQTPYALTSGGSVRVNVTVPPLGGAFNSPVTLSASGLPPGATATFNPPAVTPGANGESTVMTISLGTLASGLVPNGSSGAKERLALTFALCLGACGLSLRRRKLSLRNFLFGVFGFVLALTVLLSPGCAGGFSNQSQSAAGRYVVTITGTSGALHVSTTVTVVVQ